MSTLSIREWILLGVTSIPDSNEYHSSLKPLNSGGVATSFSAECEEVCEVLSPPLDPRLRAMLAHWDALTEVLRESLFRQFSEVVVLQSVTPEPDYPV